MPEMPKLRPAAAAIVTSALLSMNAHAVEIIAHRGASADAPENTITAERLGYEQGADGGELDVHLSKDGQPVIIHDADTKRVAGVDRKVVDQTYDELRKLEVGGWGPWQGKGFTEKIPHLDELLALVPRGKKMFIELKARGEALPAVDASLKRSKLSPDQAVIITFHHEVAEAAKKKWPQLEVYWLHDYKQDKQTGQFPDLNNLIERAKQAKVDGLNLNHNFPLDAAAVKKVHDAGLGLYVWTVDDPVKARALVAAGVDGITTNRPGALREEIAAQQ
jgi:glycerophosphoryl diester phosphodiesterase